MVYGLHVASINKFNNKKQKTKFKYIVYYNKIIDLLYVNMLQFQ